MIRQQALFDEVEGIADIDELKKIVKKLVKENLILSHRINTVVKSIQNQNTLIQYLQQSLVSMMDQNTSQADVLWGILGSETLRTFDDIIRYQLLIHDVTKNHSFGENDHKVLEELKNAALSVPYESLRTARAKCIAFLHKLKAREQGETEEKEGDIGIKGSLQTEKASSSKFQNGRIRGIFNQSRRPHISEMLKKRKERIIKRKSFTPRKNSFNKLQNSKSESSGKKNFKKKVSISSKVVKFGETSQSDMENVHSKKFPRRQGFKRKAGEVDESCLNLENNLVSVDKTAEKNLTTTKKMRSTPNCLKFVDETVKLKTLIIKLNDFMIDPSADNDECIALYKQSNTCKDNEGNEFESLDETCDDVDLDERAESDHNSDDNQEEDRTSFKSPESEDNQDQDSTLSKSCLEDVNDGGLTRERKIFKSPCTPPLSPVRDEALNFRRGPGTPSLSPPPFRRGPRTPPGDAPTSDSEGSNQGSTLDIISEEATEVEFQFSSRNADHVVLKKDSN